MDSRRSLTGAPDGISQFQQAVFAELRKLARRLLVASRLREKMQHRGSPGSERRERWFCPGDNLCAAVRRHKVAGLNAKNFTEHKRRHGAAISKQPRPQEAG